MGAAGLGAGKKGQTENILIVIPAGTACRHIVCIVRPVFSAGSRFAEGAGHGIGFRRGKNEGLQVGNSASVLPGEILLVVACFIQGGAGHSQKAGVFQGGKIGVRSIGPVAFRKGGQFILHPIGAGLLTGNIPAYAGAAGVRNNLKNIEDACGLLHRLNSGQACGRLSRLPTGDKDEKDRYYQGKEKCYRQKRSDFFHKAISFPVRQAVRGRRAR